MVPGVPSDAVVTHPDSAGSAVCGHCKSDDRWILHQVHHRKIFRLLCTACVLKLHTTSFCPICFSLHHRHRKSPSPAPPPQPDIRGTLVCFKCNSPSHVNCVAPNTPKSPYLCPTCLNPSSKLFDLSKSGSPNRSIDLRMAKALRAAAMIAANSLNDAAEQARAEAERKAKEAVSARKRSKDALARVADVWIKEMEKTGEAGQNGLVGFKAAVNNGGLAERKDVVADTKVMNGFPSSSHQLQQENKL